METRHDGRFAYITVPDLRTETLIDAMLKLANFASIFEMRLDGTPELRDDEGLAATIRFQIKSMS